METEQMQTARDGANSSGRQQPTRQQEVMDSENVHGRAVVADAPLASVPSEEGWRPRGDSNPRFVDSQPSDNPHHVKPSAPAIAGESNTNDLPPRQPHEDQGAGQVPGAGLDRPAPHPNEARRYFSTSVGRGKTATCVDCRRTFKGGTHVYKRRAVGSVSDDTVCVKCARQDKTGLELKRGQLVPIGGKP